MVCDGHDRTGEFIGCDRCGCIDAEERFLHESSLNLREFLLEKQGIDIETEKGRGTFQTCFAGAVCPACGNYGDIDMDPFDTRRGFPVPPEYEARKIFSS